MPKRVNNRHNQAPAQARSVGWERGRPRLVEAASAQEQSPLFSCIAITPEMPNSYGCAVTNSRPAWLVGRLRALPRQQRASETCSRDGSIGDGAELAEYVGRQVGHERETDRWAKGVRRLDTVVEPDAQLRSDQHGKHLYSGFDCCARDDHG